MTYSGFNSKEMMATESSITTRGLCAGSDSVVEEHLKSVAAIWPTVLQTGKIHWRLIQELTSVAQPAASKSDVALVAVACHAFNLFGEILGAGLRGRFDCDAHLLRPLHDAAGVAFEVGLDEAKAETFLAGGKVPASRGRKAMLAKVAEVNPDLAMTRSVEWSDRAEQLNKASHLSLLHADRVVILNGNALQPVAGGSFSAGQMRTLVNAACNAELEFFIAVWVTRNKRLGPSWPDDILAMLGKFKEWTQSSNAD